MPGNCRFDQDEEVVGESPLTKFGFLDTAGLFRGGLTEKSLPSKRNLAPVGTAPLGSPALLGYLSLLGYPTLMGYAAPMGGYIPPSNLSHPYTPSNSSTQPYYSGGVRFQSSTLTDVRSQSPPANESTAEQLSAERANRAQQFYTRGVEAENKEDLREAKALFNRVVQFYTDTLTVSDARDGLERVNKKLALSTPGNGRGTK